MPYPFLPELFEVPSNKIILVQAVLGVAICLWRSGGRYIFGQNKFQSKGKFYTISEFHTCSSEVVVYCMSCPWGLLYVGRTIRTLHKRFGKNRRLVDDQHSVPKHYFTHHHHSVLQGSHAQNLPAAEHFKRLCTRESYWIYRLDTLAPGGLNEELERIFFFFTFYSY